MRDLLLGLAVAVAIVIALAAWYTERPDVCGPYRIMQLAAESDAVCDALNSQLLVFKGRDLVLPWKKPEPVSQSGQQIGQRRQPQPAPRIQPPNQTQAPQQP